MKRFIVSVLCVTVFCIGLGALAEQVGARFKSDEKALELIKQARLAIGGDQSIAEVRSMVIKGNTTINLKIDGTSRSEQGETEIALQLPANFSKMVKIGRGEGPVSEKRDVFIMRQGDMPAGGERKVVVRKMEGGNGEIEKLVVEGKDGELTTADGKKVIIRKTEGGDIETSSVGGERGRRVMLEHDAAAAGHAAHHQQELLRTTLSLLLSAPQGMEANYTSAGEGDVDGTTCNIVNVEAGGLNMKLYLSKASSLPVMVSYQGHPTPNVMFFRSKAPAGAEQTSEATHDRVMFNHNIEGPAMAEVQVRFGDYRSVSGVQLPFRWTMSIGSQTTEVFDVTGYEINPPNIAEKFQNQKVLLRTKAGQ